MLKLLYEKRFYFNFLPTITMNYTKEQDLLSYAKSYIDDTTTTKRLSSNAIKFDNNKYRWVVLHKTVVFVYEYKTWYIRLDNWWRTSNTTNRLMNYWLNQYWFNIRTKKWNLYIENKNTLKSYEYKSWLEIDDKVFIS